MTGLPEHLTDTVTVLRRQHPANLIADATLYDLKPDLKAEILIAHAKALPVEQRVQMVTALTKSEPAKLDYRIEDADGVVIGEMNSPCGQEFRYVHADGTVQRLRSVKLYREVGPGAQYRGVLVVEVLTD